MRIEHLPLNGLVAVYPERHCDERGYFTRTFCRDAFREAGLADCSLQISLSHNIRRGTLRGMHFQKSPHNETKLVRCSQGAVFDVAVDIRKNSSSFGRWYGMELSSENGFALYIPSGFAHGFVSLLDDTDLIYQMAEPFVAEAAAGFRWDDPSLAIAWPIAPAVISERDKALPTAMEAGLE